jgi:hypothetical protein
MAPNGADIRDRGISHLVANVADGFSKLFSQHLALARTELQQDAKAMAVDAGLIAAFVPFVLVGYALLCVALGVFLGRWLGLAGGVAAVGGANVLGGGLGIAAAARRLKRRQLLEGSKMEIGRSAAVLKMSSSGAPQLPERANGK